MSPLIVIVASMHLSISNTINIVAQPSENLDECRSVGEMAIKAATVEPGSYASYVCHDTTRQQGLSGALGVVAYVKASDGKIRIVEGYKPTIAECKIAGQAAVASRPVPVPMSWMCYDLKSFE
ncbi:hypothetical protein L6654_24150 [Bradyrhizobium sp. WYCCWR 13023]|uniref:Uncharacterized protein n=1 Tax=Bradyrhizobium zhengyangense TaxID=2911009 RepID=A0A9X1RDP2_9BRAD|nr:hypothetical protein [Bradyrhizobium zhengyangense]MCG2629720.1 hypothetical protein [Bradyrhizobium zhengyangense]